MTRVGRNWSAWRLCAGECPACPRAPSTRPCNPSGSSTSSCTPSIDRVFWQGMCDAVRRGASIGMYNDDSVIASLMNLGLAIKKAVFEDGWLSLGELRDALADYFARRESLRQRLLNRYPKFSLFLASSRLPVRLCRFLFFPIDESTS